MVCGLLCWVRQVLSTEHKGNHCREKGPCNLCQGEKHAPQGRRQSPEGNKVEECPHLSKPCTVFKHTRQTMGQPQRGRTTRRKGWGHFLSGSCSRREEEDGRGTKRKATDSSLQLVGSQGLHLGSRWGGLARPAHRWGCVLGSCQGHKEDAGGKGCKALTGRYQFVLILVILPKLHLNERIAVVIKDTHTLEFCET